jgi:uncharacterized repeat protein (TIGR03803 family)
MPFAGLTLDSAGNLYGTTSCGGSSNYGTVFKIDKYDTFSVLYNFPEPWQSPGCGGGPSPGSLTLDAAANVYGAGGGGNGTCNNGFNCGAVFKLDPSGKETTLHAFGWRSGWYPNLGLIRDASGNLYGTTFMGGKYGHGVVFKLDSAGNETVLHSFGAPPDGAFPNAGLVQDAAGNFYGITNGGGLKICHFGSSTTCGVVFKVDRNGNETVFYSFTGGTDGEDPWGGLLIDPAGNLYGIAGGGEAGGGGYGVLFKIDPSGRETVLYHFAEYQGGYVTAMDSAGNFYGAAQDGGNPNDCVPPGGHGCGFVFKITP